MQEFWKKEPTRPFSDWRTYMIGIPVLSSAWGACLFMFLAFSFTELGAIPDVWRTWIVVIAAFSTALGSAFGSIGSSVEVYTKAFEGRARKLDWTSLILSVLATLGGFVLGFAALLVGAEWAVLVRLWGPIALSVLVAGDAASDVIQLGGLFASYNMRYQAWLDEKREFDEANGNIVLRTGPLEVKFQFDSAWPTAKIEDFRRILDQMNGSRATLTEDGLTRILFENKLNLPSGSSVKRWLKMARS